DGNLASNDLRLEEALQLGLEVRANGHRHVVEVDHQRRIRRVGGGFFVCGAWQMIVCLLRCHNELCSCPGAGQARSTALTVMECTTLSCRVGLLVKAYCAVVKAGWCVGRSPRSPRRAGARY